VRQKCLISSANEGNVLILPREGGYVFRMYVELDKLRPDEKAASKQVHPGRHDRRGQPHHPALLDRREGGRLVVDL
jgi:hypothetical protein